MPHAAEKKNARTGGIMKTDARVRYTKQVLKSTLLGLLEHKPINKITVKEVCEIAQINRATFYSHYADCFDLLEQIENEFISEFEKSLSYIDGLDVRQLVVAIYDIIDKNIDLCRALIFANTNQSLLHRMVAIAHDSSIENWRNYLKKASDNELEMLFTCLSNGLMQTVVDGYQKYDRNEVMNFVNAMVKNSMKMYM